MKQILTMMAAAILFTITASAQYMPHIQFGYNGYSSADGCQADFEVKLYCYDVGTDSPVGETAWFAAPNSGMQYSYSDISGMQTWVTDPGAASASNDWEFYKVDIRTCTAPSTSGSTVGPPCGSNNLDGCTVDPVNCCDCFKYTNSCTSCGPSNQIDCSFTGGQIATLTTSEL